MINNKNDFNNFIEKRLNESFDCGSYFYKSKFLGIKKKARLKMPMDMYSDGLLILGSYKSYRRRLAANYANKLVKSGRKVIYLSDLMDLDDVEIFNKHIKSELDNSLIHENDFVDFNENCFKDGAILSIIRANKESKDCNKAAQKEYDDTLNELISKNL